MREVTIKEFNTNNVMIMAFTEQQKEIRTNFLKKAGYEFFNQSTFKNSDCVCKNGGIHRLTESFYGGVEMRFCTVYQLENYNIPFKPEPKELTLKQVIDELGYEVKIVK